MKDLIAKLEAASEGSRELDFLIAVAVGHHEIRMSECDGMSELWDVSREREYLVGSEYQWHKFDGPFYTTSIDAALTLVPEGYQYKLVEQWSVGAFCVLAGYSVLKSRLPCPSNKGDPEGRAAPPALAICIAASKARNEE